MNCCFYCSTVPRLTTQGSARRHKYTVRLAWCIECCRPILAAAATSLRWRQPQTHLTRRACLLLLPSSIKSEFTVGSIRYKLTFPLFFFAAFDALSSCFFFFSSFASCFAAPFPALPFFFAMAPLPEQGIYCTVNLREGLIGFR